MKSLLWLTLVLFTTTTTTTSATTTTTYHNNVFQSVTKDLRPLVLALHAAFWAFRFCVSATLKTTFLFFFHNTQGTRVWTIEFTFWTMMTDFMKACSHWTWFQANYIPMQIPTIQKEYFSSSWFPEEIISEQQQGQRNNRGDVFRNGVKHDPTTNCWENNICTTAKYWARILGQKWRPLSHGTLGKGLFLLSVFLMTGVWEFCPV